MVINMKNKSLMVILFISLVFVTSCAPKISPEEESTAETEKDDFGCSPPSTCSLMKDPFAKQFCEDWRAGKDVWSTIPDCSFMTTEGCRKLCEVKTKGRNKTSMPNMPSPEDFPNPADFPDPEEMMKSMMKDMPSTPSSGSMFSSRKPVCVNDEDYHTQVIYAWPSNSANRYDQIAPKLRDWIDEANAIVNTEAENFDMTADIKISCDGEKISVLDVSLPISSTPTKETIISALKNLGYKNEKIKYIVWYDGKATGCSTGTCRGQSSGPDADDKLYVENANNKGPDYALIYKIEDSTLAPFIMLHEYSHTMGAIQKSAPNGVDNEHCNDEPPLEKMGTDIMCKSDNPATTFKDSCSGYQFRFDCNNDDYFNPKPEPGSYLATHWNLGSSLNRFILFGESSDSPSKEFPQMPSMNYPSFPSSGNYPVPPKP